VTPDMRVSVEGLENKLEEIIKKIKKTKTWQIEKIDN
jgi:hypothetical protein